VRIDLDNFDGVLAPGMFASVALSATPSKPHPLVPEEALISTGMQNRLILDLGNGRLEPRIVRIGRSAQGYTEVLAGLNGGERVVISGEFLFDSEADLNGALNRLTVPAASPVVPVASRHILYWYDPMAPQKHYNHGGQSPLMPSMDLVPQYAHEPIQAHPAKTQRTVLYWYDPMAPARHYSHGGPSPLMPSMNLVPQYSGKPAHAASPTGAQP
jgi:Cu(I)/Ag(I) efflux system membrane fusion protein